MRINDRDRSFRKHWDAQHHPGLPGEDVSHTANAPVASLDWSTLKRDEESKRRLFAQYLRGATIESLVEEFRGSKSSIRRVIRRMRAERIMDLPLDCMPNPEFDESGAAAKILAPLPEPEHAPRRARRPSGLPPYLASLYEVPLLTERQERHLFRKFNFLKYQAARLRENLDPARPRSRLMGEIEQLYNQAVSTKNQIIRANLRLVVSMARGQGSRREAFFELVSEGNMSLIRAVEKFDYSLGNKFSTYATWAIKKNFARSFVTDIRRQDRFRTSQDELLAAKPEYRADPHEQETAQHKREAQVGKILKCLDERERWIITSRFGLAPGQEPQTLRQVGQQLGVSKERIRQLEARAISKLRRAAEEARIEVPAVPA